VVFATDSEWATSTGTFGAGETAVLVLKHGARGASFVFHDDADERAPDPGPVVDVTGAGDALAAGYLVGGPDLAMGAAARCVAVRGAQPEPASEAEPEDVDA
jgi:ribokinase